MMWEPFSEPARRSIVRSQEVAQMFGAGFIGTEHMTFALAETDDAVGEALAGAVDRPALKERLGVAATAPVVEMMFTDGAKHSIEKAFENARKLNHNFIGTAHLVLGILESGDAPPLLAGVDAAELRLKLIRAALGEKLLVDPPAWKQTKGEAEPSATSRALIGALGYFPDLRVPGTRITLTVEPPEGPEQTWSWTCVDEPAK
jgi:ATP-dependent Clp protease ATP-binding subunit ClpC